MTFVNCRQNERRHPRVFGHRAVIRVRRHVRVGTGPLSHEEVIVHDIEIHRRGPESAIRAAARKTKGFESIVEIEPLTIGEYIRSYGNGTETGRQRIE